MGQLLSVIRAPRDNQALQDVAVEQQPAFDCCQCFKKAPKGYQELPSESFPPELFHPSSQPRQYSPTSVAQVAVNPAQFESASAASTMATKPGAVSVTMGGATASGATAGGSPTTAGTTQRGTAKVAMPETAFVSPAGATIIDIPTSGTKGSPKDTPKPAPMHLAKATPLTTGGGNIVVEAATPWKAEVPKLQESPKQTAKSVPTTSSKVDMAKKDPAKLVTAVAAPAAAAGYASLKGPQTKVQVEVVPQGAKAAKKELAVDPFDALADSLPSSESFAPAAHVYTGPEVIEHGLTSKKGVICGGNDCPLPPGYRFEDMAPVADVKPKDVPKPMSTDEALDSLSFGFTTSMPPIPQKQEKKVEDLAAIDALSAGFSNFAPPPPAPIKKAEEFKSAPVTKSSAPPVDKKAKVEKFADDFSLMSGLDSPLATKPKTDESVPTTSSKVDMAKKDPAKLVTAVAAPATAAGDASLKGPQTKVQVEVVPPGAKAAKEPAPMHPAKATPLTTGGGNIVGEVTTPWKAEVPKFQECPEQTAKSVPTTSSKVDMAKKDPAKLVTAVAAPAAAAGYASLKGPQTKKVEDLAAVDALSAGFSNFAPPPPAPIKKAEEFKSAPVTKSPAPLVDKKAKVEKFADDFSLMSGLDSPLAIKPKTDEVQVEVVPPGAKAAKEPAPMHPAKATPLTTGGGNIVGEVTTPWKAEVPKLQESPEQTAKSVPTTSSKVDMAKKDPAKLVTSVAAPAAVAGDASLKGPQTKVQVEVVPPGAKAAKEPAPMHPAKATPLTTGGGNIVGEVTTQWKAEVPKLQESPEQTAKVQVEVVPPGAKAAKKELAVDPFDALADSLPSSESFAPAAHVYTGPEVIEHGLSSKKAVICGGNDCPLPPGYRFEDMAPVADVKPKDVPKPMSTDEALDSLSFGFTTSMPPIPQKQEKKVEDLAAIDALSAGFSNFAPPPPAPIKKAEEFKSAPVTKSPAPPVDKKAKVEKFADDFSLMSGLDSPLATKPKTDEVQVEVVPPGAKAAKGPAPMHPAKATPLTTGGGNIVGEVTTPWKAEVPKLQESPEQTAKSVPTTSSKVDMAKKDPAKLVTAVAAPAAAAGDASLKGPQTKVQVEVVPQGAKAAKKELAVDPFDALADSLPSSESFAPAAHVYTGPEVIEHGLSSKKGVICGGNDCPLPPGYRFEDMSPVADVKPKDVPKPMSTDEALDSLSFGFTSSMAPIPQKQEKKVEDLAAIDALSAGFSNFAPPPPAPIKKAEEFKSAPVTKSPAPPVDKKAKVEKFADDFSLMSGLDSPLATKPKTDESVPTTSSKVDMAKKDPAKLVTAVAAPAAVAGDASLKGPQTKVQVEVVPPGAKAAKEPAPMHPAKATPLTTGGGNIVGEVTTPWKAEVPKLQESPEQTAKSVPTTSSKVDMAKKDPAKLVTAVAAPAAAAGDASLKGPQTKVQVEVVPPGAKAAKEPAPMHPAKATPLTTGGGNIVGEVTTPWKAEVPKLQECPEQTAKSVPTTSSKVDMAKKDPAKLVAAVAAPAAAAGDAFLKGPQTKKVEDLAAVDALSAGFSNFAPPPPAPIKKAEEFKSAPVTKSPAPPVDKKAKVEKFADDFSLMSGLDSPLATKPKTDEGGSMSLDALSALGHSLPAPEPAPEPPKIRHEDIVTEGKLTSKKGVFVGERDDTLPPKYRFTENKVKDLPPLKPEPSLDSGEALDILSGDFMSSCVAPAVHAPVLCPPALPTQASDDFALDALAGDFVAPAVAPAVKSAVDRQEKKVIEEKLTKVGERDDSLPAEYRPTEKDRKAMAEAKVQADVRPKQPSMDDSKALDLLSRDLSSSAGPAAASVAVTAEQRQPRLEPMSAPVLDDLAGTLLPDTPEFKSKGDKPKNKSRSKSKKQRKEDPSSIDHLPGQLSSDVVSASTNKDGKS
ncbi:calpastatin isoform X10 [Oncorhynchus tshawytscha]|uniref:calpastatin isoform X10 n=1 Tax=Oncorhynchus tshawytscha TaxID=74940 RepID=UPI001C3DFB49|nr:calpastatin isoform X10 [Oncorhynchus tshawytscha]